MTYCACRNVCLRSQFEVNTIIINVSGENSRREEIIFPDSVTDASDLSHSAVNFSEAGVSETQQGSGEHEDVIGRVSSLVRNQVATPSRGWLPCKTSLFGSFVLTNNRNSLFFVSCCLSVRV